MEVILRSPTLAKGIRTLRVASNSPPAPLPVSEENLAKQLHASDLLNETDCGKGDDGRACVADATTDCQSADPSAQAINTYPSVASTEDLEAIFSAAAERGYTEGLRRGMEACNEEGLRRIAQMDGLIRALAAARVDLVRRSADDIICIATEVAYKFLGDELVAAEGIAAHVKQVLGRVEDNRGVTIRLHPYDLELLRDANLTRETEAGAIWRADASLDVGGCVVEATGGTFEANLERQLTDLTRALKSVRSLYLDESEGMQCQSTPA